MTFDLAGKRVWVAGHRGMVGSAIFRRLFAEDCTVFVAHRDRCDLLVQCNVERYFEEVRPDVVIIAAAKVGGIAANSAEPADFLYENLVIASNIIDGAFEFGVQKLLFLGSSCIYPRDAPQPMREEYLLTGPLEPTNEWYAIAKIAGIKLCQAYRRQHGCDFISCLPTNLYGPGDKFDPEKSHVIPALMRKMHDAKISGQPWVEVWGTGMARREFLYVDDLADACVYLLKNYSDEMPINIGCEWDIRIYELAGLIRDIVGFKGALVANYLKPEGPPQKLLHCSRMDALGWIATTRLKDGLQKTYEWYLKQCAS